MSNRIGAWGKWQNNLYAIEDKKKAPLFSERGLLLDAFDF
jgi:hypothetical protein